MFPVVTERHKSHSNLRNRASVVTVHSSLEEILNHPLVAECSQDQTA